MAYTITLIPGDGIGPEITKAAVRVLDATGLEFVWEEHEGGIQSFEKTGNLLPEPLLESIRRNKLALKGPLTTLVGEGFRVRTWRCARSSTSMPTFALFEAFPV